MLEGFSNSRALSLDMQGGFFFVAHLPNPSHTADPLPIAAGTDSQATDAAAKFVPSEDSLEKLFKKFPLQAASLLLNPSEDGPPE
jgi:hypothetical protein